MRDLPSQAAVEAVVKSILGLGRSLGIGCVGEGVETHQRREYLQKHLRVEMQAFLYSQPVPARSLAS